MKNDLKNQVFDKIHKKEIFMYPRIYFIAQMVIIIIISLMTFLSMAFVISFIFFSTQESGKQFLLGFGVRGIFTFLKLFPWMSTILTTLLFILLEWMLRRFKFSYRFPILLIFIYTLIVTILFSILLTFTPLHISLLKKADTNQLPIIGRIYEEIHDSHEADGTIRGNITSIQNDSLIMSHNDNDKDADDGVWNVVLPPNFDSSNLYLGEKIYVAGKASGGNFYAYGIHEFSPN